jgi:hypothetical protein
VISPVSAGICITTRTTAASPVLADVLLSNHGANSKMQRQSEGHRTHRIGWLRAAGLLQFQLEKGLVFSAPRGTRRYVPAFLDHDGASMNASPTVTDFPIVCVGGSAGGLDAYLRLLQH